MGTSSKRTIDMGCHSNSEIHSKDKTAKNVIVIAICLIMVFISVEVTGGYLAGSLAIMSDAAHMFSDMGALMLSLFAIWLSRRPPNSKMSFGYYRAEVLGAVCNILIIWLLTGVLIYLATKRIANNDYNIDVDTMLLTAALAIMFNFIIGSILYYGGIHGHYHIKTPQSYKTSSNGCKLESISTGEDLIMHNDQQQRNNRNINVRAAFLHVCGDFIQSIGIFVAAIVIKLKPEYQIVDPICTFIFSILVLLTTCIVLCDAVHVLMEGSPRDINEQSQLLEDLHSIPAVIGTHSFRIWSLNMDVSACSVHLMIDKSVDASAVLTEATLLMRCKYKISLATIQIETRHNILKSKDSPTMRSDYEISTDTDDIALESNIYGTF